MSVALTHPCMASSLLLSMLPLGGHIANKDNITEASRLQKNRVYMEVFKLIEDRLEPQMLDLALTLLIQ